VSLRTPLALPPSGYVRTADVISALSIAADFALGLPAEHSARSCYIAIRIAQELRLSIERQGEVYYTTLLLDAGCTAWTSAFAAYLIGDEIVARTELYFGTNVRDPLAIADWLRHYMAPGAAIPRRAERFADFLLNGRERMREGFRNTCAVSSRFAERLGMPATVQEALMHVFEQWDGEGMPDGAAGASVPVAARIAHLAIFAEFAQRRGNRDEALQIVLERRGKSFDPTVVDTFEAVAADPAFWERLEQATVLELVRSLEPAVPYRFIPEARLLDMALFAADFTDLKSRFTLGHGRRVAATAVAAARAMSLPEPAIRSIQLAALLHDLGLVAVPSFVLEKADRQRTPAEQETLRLHPYHAERILARIAALEEVAALVGAHHERIDGRGYYRGLAGPRIPLGARVLAVVDVFDELTHDRPGQPALDPSAALSVMQADVGSAFDPEVWAAFLSTIPAAQPRMTTAPTPDRPAGLTTREVEVLRLAATGMTRKEIANRLFVSQSTVRSHLEHIYAKIGVSTRAAATLFAVEHNLIA